MFKYNFKFIQDRKVLKNVDVAAKKSEIPFFSYSVEGWKADGRFYSWVKVLLPKKLKFFLQIMEMEKLAKVVVKNEVASWAHVIQ